MGELASYISIAILNPWNPRSDQSREKLVKKQHSRNCNDNCDKNCNGC